MIFSAKRVVVGHGHLGSRNYYCQPEARKGTWAREITVSCDLVARMAYYHSIAQILTCSLNSNYGISTLN